MVKIALCTTFPNWAEYPKETIPTWIENLPKDLITLIGLDPCPNLPKTEEWLFPLAQERMKAKTLYISRNFQQDQIDFLKRNKEKDNKDYRLAYARFSFKVFTLKEAMVFAVEDNMDYLIWLDADVVFKKPINEDNFKEWLPKEEVATYLGRKDWDHSECGFIIFNLKKGGKEFIERMYQMYITDEVLTLSQWHDSFVFDTIRAEFNKANKKDVFRDLTAGIEGRDIFEKSPLAEFMEHKKGPAKFQNGPIDLNQLKVLTKNCVDHDIIRKHVTENLKLITKWVEHIKEHKEEIVIANAGPSLDPECIRSYYDRGYKIVAVKHALKKLLDAGIIPWACILLDPREHVKDFIDHPKAKRVKWFVASMVSPKVTKVLLQKGCDVWGYHAYVGAEENKLIPKGHVMVTGGSATCTRGLCLLNGLLKFRKFHLFGYDLCSFDKPDLEQKKNGRPVWIDTELEATNGDLKLKRQFYTKGEFLAQVQEIQQLLDLPEYDLKFYGDTEKGGIIPWLAKCHKNTKKLLKKKNKQLECTLKSLSQLFEKHGS